MRDYRWGALGTAAVIAVFGAGEAHAQAASNSTIVVVGVHNEDQPAKLEHIQREVDGPIITVTKKSSITRLDLVPTTIGNNQRGVFANTPGLLAAEQQSPAQFNLSYRGLGSPEQSQSVLVLQDGLPIASDWIGYPALHYQPLPQSLSEIQLLRGGSTLLYGPNAEPTINLVSRRPIAAEPFGAYSENVVGDDGLFSSFNTIMGSSGALSMRVNVGHVEADGQRDNGATSQQQQDGWLGYRPNAHQLWYVDADHYDVSAGDPGRIGYPQFLADAEVAPTPFNRDWVSRTSLTLGNDIDFGGGWRMIGKLWASEQNVSQRSAAPGAAPTSTTLTDQDFSAQGLDARFVRRWARGNAFTFGATFYRDDAPLRQWSSTEITAPRDRDSGTPLVDQDRESAYAAVFAENVFRLPHRWHVVPSMRVERQRISVKENVRLPSLTRPLIDTDATRTQALFAFGAGFDFGHQNETYFNVSQGYRPSRFADIAPPFAETTPDGAGHPSRSVTWEAGVHGTPVDGLFYDASVFWVEVQDRIETVALSPSQFVNQNTGDTRHRGFEGQISYDFLAARDDGLHLLGFANLSLLDARFTTETPGIGERPAFAPRVIARYGVRLRSDAHYDVALTLSSVSSQYFQDSNVSAGTGASFVPAKVPRYTLADIAGDWYITPHVRLLGGVSNLTDEHYYSRALQDGVEPGAGRSAYVGLALGF